MEKNTEFYSPGQNKSICKSLEMFLNHFNFRPKLFIHQQNAIDVNNTDHTPVLSELF